MIEGHGDDIYLYGDKVRHNFSSNIVPGADRSRLFSHLRSKMESIGSYPEPAPFSLERIIAGKIGVDACNVVVTNGATDAMYRVAHLTEGRRSSILIPAFREYQDACRSFHHNISFAKNIREIPEGSDVIWVCSPGNPGGEVLEKNDILGLACCCGLAVVDQAYADYTEKETLTPREAVEAGNIVLLSSLTKRYSVPGLRIGYAVAAEPLASSVREKGMPWAVNSLALEAGQYLFTHDADYPVEKETLHAEILRIAETFGLMGISCSHTDCNFMLCRLPHGCAAELKHYLVERHGILIRDASNFEGLDGRFFRVAAQTQAQNNLLIKAVEEWMS